jgi:hypothetical protein
MASQALKARNSFWGFIICERYFDIALLSEEKIWQSRLRVGFNMK